MSRIDSLRVAVLGTGRRAAIHLAALAKLRDRGLPRHLVSPIESVYAATGIAWPTRYEPD